MLFVTTRNKYDAQTTRKMLSSDTGSDGGLYIPFQMPTFTQEQITELMQKSFGQAVADVLNLFFGTRLTGAEVDFSIGRNCVRMKQMNHRIVIAETWRNLAGDYARTEGELARMVCTNFGCETKRTSLLRIVIRIAVLFGIFGELTRVGIVSKEQSIDVAVPTGDFSAAMAVWYCRMFGLPVGNIVAACNENSGIWELFHLGELHTDAVLNQTGTPLSDYVVAPELERLIHAVGGIERVAEFTDAVASGRIYRPEEEFAVQLKDGMFSAVVSTDRLKALIPSVYRTNAYIFGAYSALAYGGLMDYRAKTGHTRCALILAERSPMCDSSVVADAMDMSIGRLQDEVTKA